MVNKTTQILENWRSGTGIIFINDKVEAAYKSRAGRIADVIQLRIPDRVPVVPSFGMFPFLDNGLSCEEAVFGYEKAHQSAMKTLEEFQPDMFLGSGCALPAPFFEALGYRLLKWPGREIPSDYTYQFVEEEYVTAEEFYDCYLDDPSDFMLRVYLPKVCNQLDPLKQIRPFTESVGYSILSGSYEHFGRLEVQNALMALMKAGEESLKWVNILEKEAAEILSLGYPLYEGGGTYAPYDIVGNWFRSTRGVMLDMYRHPEKLLSVMEKIVPIFPFRR